MLGIYFVQNGYTTLGSLTAIYSLYGAFSFQFLQLGRYLPELIGCLVNSQNIFDFLDEEEEPECWYVKAEPEVIGNGVQTDEAVKMENIEFCYCEDKPLLKDFSMSVDLGESAAITGPSGCGKTTLSKLLLGLYPVKKGDILIEGQSYHKLLNSDIREKISYNESEQLVNEALKSMKSKKTILMIAHRPSTIALADKKCVM